MTAPDKSILILTGSNNMLPEISHAFQDRGFYPITSKYSSFSSADYPLHAPRAIIIDVEDETSDIRATIEQLKLSYPGMSIPVLALLKSIPPIETDVFDSVLLYPCHPVQVVLRASGLIRLAEMEQEIGHRLQTLSENFDISPSLNPPKTQDRFKILFIGKASPEFMVVINALQNENVNVVAAFTSFTAFDYLYEQVFDAVVMNGLQSTETAFSITQTMRKNARLYHVPALLLTDSTVFKDHDAAYQAGVSDIIDTKAELKDISSRILEQANFHSMHKDLKKEFGAIGGDACIDASTGLFNRSFFDAHLTRILNIYTNLSLPVSLCLIRVKSSAGNLSPENLEIAGKQIGNMIKNLVRLHDVTARLDSNLFAIAFSGQTPQQLKPVSERISSILKCAAINDPLTGMPIDLKLEITLSQLNKDNDMAVTA